MPSEIWVAALSVIGMIGSAVGGALVTRWRGRREREAQAEQMRLDQQAQMQQITAAAHKTLSDAYAEMFEEMRALAGAAREEARTAREAARGAVERAEKAEERAYNAEHRMRLMERLLTDLRPLIEAHVPGAEIWLGQFDRVAAMSRTV